MIGRGLIQINKIILLGFIKAFDKCFSGSLKMCKIIFLYKNVKQHIYSFGKV